ncbi:MAG TPA: hypothetical protein VGE52_08495 [Pirellulales bacterium]
MEESDLDRLFVQRTSLASGVFVDVQGEQPRFALARRIVEHRENVAAQGLDLRRKFLRPSGEFDLNEITVFENWTHESGDFLLSFCFTADRDPNWYGYTYFHVFFCVQRPSSATFPPDQVYDRISLNWSCRFRR